MKYKREKVDKYSIEQCWDLAADRKTSSIIPLGRAPTLLCKREGPSTLFFSISEKYSFLDLSNTILKNTLNKYTEKRHQALFRLDESGPSSVKEKDPLPFSFQYLRNTVSKIWEIHVRRHWRNTIEKYTDEKTSGIIPLGRPGPFSVKEKDPLPFPFLNQKYLVFFILLNLFWEVIMGWYFR